MLTDEVITDIAYQLDAQVKVHSEGCLTIRTLVQPYEQLIYQTLTYDQLQAQINQFYSPHLAKIVLNDIVQHIEANQEPDDPTISPKLLKQIQKLSIRYLAGGILETAIEHGQDRQTKLIDSYDIYVGIRQNEALAAMFESSLPSFPYIDELRVSKILKSYSIQYTSGFKQGLQNYVDTIVQLVQGQDISNIYQLTKQFGETQESDSRIFAIHQLKAKIVNYVIESQNQDGHEYTFSDVISSLKFLQKT